MKKFHDKFGMRVDYPPEAITPNEKLHRRAISSGRIIGALRSDSVAAERNCLRCTRHIQRVIGDRCRTCTRSHSSWSERKFQGTAEAGPDRRRSRAVERIAAAQQIEVSGHVQRTAVHVLVPGVGDNHTARRAHGAYRLRGETYSRLADIHFADTTIRKVCYEEVPCGIDGYALSRNTRASCRETISVVCSRSISCDGDNRSVSVHPVLVHSTYLQYRDCPPHPPRHRRVDSIERWELVRYPR
jgi:hypothetical protein